MNSGFKIDKSALVKVQPKKTVVKQQPQQQQPKKQQPPKQQVDQTTTTTEKKEVKKEIQQQKQQEKKTQPVVPAVVDEEVGRIVEVRITDIDSFKAIGTCKLAGVEYTATLYRYTDLNRFPTLSKGKNVKCKIVAINKTSKTMVLSNIEFDHQKTPLYSSKNIPSEGKTVPVCFFNNNNGELVALVGLDLFDTIDIVSSFRSLFKFKQFRMDTYVDCIVQDIKHVNETPTDKQYQSLRRIKVKFADKSIGEAPPKPSLGLVVLGYITSVTSKSLVVKTRYCENATVDCINIDDSIRSQPLSIYKKGMFIAAIITKIIDSNNNSADKVEESGMSLSLKPSILGPKIASLNPTFKNDPVEERQANQYGYIVGITKKALNIQISENETVEIAKGAIPSSIISLLGVGVLVKLTKSATQKKTKQQKQKGEEEGQQQPVLSWCLDLEFPPEDELQVGDLLTLSAWNKTDKYYYFNNLGNKSQQYTKGISASISETIELKVPTLTKIISINDKFISVTSQVDMEEIEERAVLKSLGISWFNNDLDETIEEEKQKEEEKEEEQDNNGIDVEYELKEWDMDEIDNTLPSAKQKESLLKRKMDNYEEKRQQRIDEGMAEEDILDEEDFTNLKRQKTDKKSKRLEKERDIKLREDSIADNDTVPESTQDFERVLMGSPNSSYVWIQYMSFHLGLSEISKAREIGERALKKILHTEVVELRNVWTALLNLENMYGSEASLMTLFKRCIMYQDAKIMYLTIIHILEKGGKADRAEQYFTMLLKKHRHSAKAWCRYGEFLASTGQWDKFQDVMKKIPKLESLQKRKKIEVLSKFGQIEFKLGEVDRGRNIFEMMVGENPTRCDLWNVYIDMELKHASQKHIRLLFERTVSLKVSDRNIKQFFKRYLQYEKEHGDERSIDNVKQLALQYVEKS